MKEKFGKVLRLIVGSECGMFGESNRQWYYTLALAISVMLAWCKLTQQEAIVFTIVSLVHIISVHVYALCGLEDYKSYSIAYIVLHLIVVVTAFLTNWIFAIGSICIVALFLIISPDECGLCVFTVNSNNQKANEYICLITHTIVLALFVITVCILPVIWWVKVLIICLALALHPLIDYLSGECVDVVMIAFEDLPYILR